MKPQKISLKTKKPWQLPKGHTEHQSGSGEHDSREKRKRTRKEQIRQILKEFE